MIADLRVYCLLLAFARTLHGEAHHAAQLGAEVKPESYPFLVHVYIIYDMFGEEKGVPCGGAYIKAWWVVTAGMCLRNFTVSLAVPVDDNAVECRMGLRSGDLKFVKETEAIRSAKIFTHPDFKMSIKRPMFAANLGLVLLQKAFDLSPTVATASIPTSSVDYIGKEVTIIGYSSIAIPAFESEDDEPPIGHTLRMKACKVWTQDKCRAKNDYDNQFCFGEPASHPWAYDVGGPIVFSNQIIGVTVPNMNPSELTKYGVGQDLFAYKSWIDTTISSNLAGRKSTSASQRPVPIPVVYLNLALVYLIKFM